ncbi:hypothetical protein ACFSJU_19105 [Paradesertivirga mongoliensis]|uniref:Uncharacterized protein n=1 Tax=Paradesertivirga mongoliensis TaxID=2100740 RepID=A0ABW4ZRS1_9SPHI|nr:hypothetical protein [Pedobacter mongoliensis]
MEVTQNAYSEVFDFLNKQLIDGKTWLVHHSTDMINSISDLHCFSKASDARQFEHDNTSHFDRYCTKRIKTFLRTLKSTHMNSQNLEFLQTNLKYFGFGDKLNDDLKKNIEAQKAEFQLKIEIPHFNNKMDYTLHFKKSNTSDMYFFNRYDAGLKNGKHENDKAHSFYVNKGSGITAKEAFNLLEGRSVYKDLVSKEGEKYSAWVKLDFENTDKKGNHLLKQFSEKYGFDLGKTLSNYPIKELQDPEQKKQLISSLNKGNVQQVSMNPESKEGKFYIEAIPQFKNINVYDSKMHLLKRQSLQNQNSGKSLSTSQDTLKKPMQKKDLDEQPAKQKQTRKRKLSV